MSKIPLYQNEIISGVIKHPNTIRASCPIQLSRENHHNIELPSAIAKANPNQLDLYYLNTILVSVGWNANDDIFSKEALWDSKDTPQDKPFNLEHQPETIIGHITGNFILDEDFKVIEDGEFEDLPNKFHLATSAVIYRQLSKRNPQLSETISTIIDEIDEGDKWFVSMECLFNDFDYGLIDSKGDHHIISRNEETSFLTKHMKSYGGSGIFKDFKIGRLVKNVVFSGKGLVQNPANAESIIFDKDSVNDFIGVANKLEDVILDAKGEEKIMSDKPEKVIALESEVANLKDRLNKVDEDKIQGQFKTLQDSVDGANKERDEAKATLSVKDDEISTLTKAAKVSKEENKTLSDDLKASNEKLDKIAVEAQEVQRISSLVDAGVDKDKAKELVAEKYAKLDDVSFESVIDIHKQLIEAKMDKDGDRDKKDKKKKKDEDSKASNDLQDSQASTDELEDVKDDDDLDLNAEASDEQTALFADISSYVTENIE